MNSDVKKGGGGASHCYISEMIRMLQLYFECIYEYKLYSHKSHLFSSLRKGKQLPC